MKAMEEKILREGQILPGEILKVGSFLNQQIDTEFLREMAEEIATLFKDCGATKILTVEASGIAIATAAGLAMNIPVLFAKKHKTSNVDGEILSAPVHSYTHGTDYNIVVSKSYLSPGDKVLMVDDFLASGNAFMGLLGLINGAGATCVGACAAIEKRFQGGGDMLRKMGIRLESLAIISAFEGNSVVFDSI
ncbi:MAG: xanthine phosphoribosyltransferase [Oscillospiraceae bacterium]|nr:xanthine phosphoribosyltransferase [Oscillospiraceae bacterium]